MRHRITFWILRIATRLHRDSIDLALHVHVGMCQRRGCRYVDLDNCDSNSFCYEGRQMFDDAFDLTEKLEEMRKAHLMAHA